MARLLVSGIWHDQLASTSMYEFDYENLVGSQSANLFPDYHVVQFKHTVSSEEGSAKPDLALIDKEYGGWWVVETELSHHSLTSHVLPQIQILARADYGMREADALCRSGELDRDRVGEMMKGAPPGILLVVDTLLASWVEALRM